jgi:YebC/PmpR family DNA-binding regulatory protein
MAGHNKWSKVKHIKERVDAKKGKVFSKISREITIAARLGGRDPEMNPRLRTALLAGRAANMPNDNVDRAIKKGVGELEGALPEEITYEGYAPGGVAMLIEAVTDNKNRSSADLRTAFNKGSGTMGRTRQRRPPLPARRRNQTPSLRRPGRCHHGSRHGRRRR